MTATLPARHRPSPLSGSPLSEPPSATPHDGRPPAMPPGRPRWQRPAVAVLLLGTALLYLVNLSANGYANTYYAAAVQAGSTSWKAFLFGSLDAGNAITVDKPPASLWPMELAARVFGFSSWSMLVPQALMGVGAVWLLYATVRRWAGPVAGLIAGTVLALTPVAVLMFRYNQPDALMVLCLVAAAYAVTRAVGSGARTRWIVLAGVAMGVAFLTKSLQGLTVLPALGAVFLVGSPHGWGRRLRDLALAVLAMVVTGGWWFTLVSLWPASDRPYIGGSTTNSAWELAFGYNGLGRVTGGDGNGGSFSGAAGILRLFDAEMGGQISWLLPAALILGVATAVLVRGRARLAVTLFGGWLIVTGLLLSFMSGTVHPYYTVELAPAIGGLVGVGVVALWRQRAAVAPRVVLAAAVLATGGWSSVLLARSAEFVPVLRVVVPAVAVVAAVLVLLAGSALRARVLLVGVIAAALVGGLGGSTAYAVQTVSTSQTGSMATAGPSVAASSAGGGPGGSGGRGVVPAGGAAPSGGTTTAGPTGAATSHEAGSGGAGGGVTASGALTALLENAGTTWSAAVDGAQSAASLELATGTSVIGIGGFTGSDDAPTLAQFQQWVADGDIGYYVAGSSSGGGAGGSAAATAIASWVAAHYTATTVGSTTVYDLTP